MLLLITATGTVNAAMIYADSLIAVSPNNTFNSSNPSASLEPGSPTVNGFDQDGNPSIDSSGDITGAPNNGGYFLSEFGSVSTLESWIEVQMAAPVFLGMGADLRIFDWDAAETNADESASIYVKTNIGDAFTLVGTVIGGSSEGFLDIDPADFAGEINYVRIEGITGANALDVDALAGLHVIPLPPAILLFGSGLLGLIGLARKHNA